MGLCADYTVAKCWLYFKSSYVSSLTNTLSTHRQLFQTSRIRQPSEEVYVLVVLCHDNDTGGTSYFLDALLVFGCTRLLAASLRAIYSQGCNIQSL